MEIECTQAVEPCYDRNGNLASQPPLMRVRYLDRSNPDATYTLKRGENTIGRNPNCDVVIVHRALSKLHAVLEVLDTGDECILRDLGSKNGTRIGMQVLKKDVRYFIETNKTFLLGEVLSCSLTHEENDDSDSTASEPMIPTEQLLEVMADEESNLTKEDAQNGNSNINKNNSTAAVMIEESDDSNSTHASDEILAQEIDKFEQSLRASNSIVVSDDSTNLEDNDEDKESIAKEPKGSLNTDQKSSQSRGIDDAVTPQMNLNDSQDEDDLLVPCTQAARKRVSSSSSGLEEIEETPPGSPETVPASASEPEDDLVGIGLKRNYSTRDSFSKTSLDLRLSSTDDCEAVFVTETEPMHEQKFDQGRTSDNVSDVLETEALHLEKQDLIHVSETQECDDNTKHEFMSLPETENEQLARKESNCVTEEVAESPGLDNCVPDDVAESPGLQNCGPEEVAELPGLLVSDHLPSQERLRNSASTPVNENENNDNYLLIPSPTRNAGGEAASAHAVDANVLSKSEENEDKHAIGDCDDDNKLKESDPDENANLSLSKLYEETPFQEFIQTSHHNSIIGTYESLPYFSFLEKGGNAKDSQANESTNVVNDDEITDVTLKTIAALIENDRAEVPTESLRIGTESSGTEDGQHELQDNIQANSTPSEDEQAECDEDPKCASQTQVITTQMREDVEKLYSKHDDEAVASQTLVITTEGVRINTESSGTENRQQELQVDIQANSVPSKEEQAECNEEPKCASQTQIITTQMREDVEKLYVKQDDQAVTSQTQVITTQMREDVERLYAQQDNRAVSSQTQLITTQMRNDLEEHGDPDFSRSLPNPGSQTQLITSQMRRDVEELYNKQENDADQQAVGVTSDTIQCANFAQQETEQLPCTADFSRGDCNDNLSEASTNSLPQDLCKGNVQTNIEAAVSPGKRVAQWLSGVEPEIEQHSDVEDLPTQVLISPKAKQSARSKSKTAPCRKRTAKKETVKNDLSENSDTEQPTRRKSLRESKKTARLQEYENSLVNNVGEASSSDNAFKKPVSAAPRSTSQRRNVTDSEHVSTSVRKRANSNTSNIDDGNSGTFSNAAATRSTRHDRRRENKHGIVDEPSSSSTKRSRKDSDAKSGTVDSNENHSSESQSSVQTSGESSVSAKRSTRRRGKVKNSVEGDGSVAVVEVAAASPEISKRLAVVVERLNGELESTNDEPTSSKRTCRSSAKSVSKEFTLNSEDSTVDDSKNSKKRHGSNKSSQNSLVAQNNDLPREEACLPTASQFASVLSLVRPSRIAKSPVPAGRVTRAGRKNHSVASCSTATMTVSEDINIPRTSRCKPQVDECSVNKESHDEVKTAKRSTRQRMNKAESNEAMTSDDDNLIENNSSNKKLVDKASKPHSPDCSSLRSTRKQTNKAESSKAQTGEEPKLEDEFTNENVFLDKATNASQDRSIRLTRQKHKSAEKTSVEDGSKDKALKQPSQESTSLRSTRQKAIGKDPNKAAEALTESNITNKNLPGDTTVKLKPSHSKNDVKSEQCASSLRKRNATHASPVESPKASPKKKSCIKPTSSSQKAIRERHASVSSVASSSLLDMSMCSNMSEASKARRKGKLHVMFTGSEDKDAAKVKKIGAVKTENLQDANILVADKFYRTLKMMYCVGKGIPVVHTSWLDNSVESGEPLETDTYILRDKAAEKQYRFQMPETLLKARESPFLKGWSVFVTKRCKPSADQMRHIVEAAGGKFLVQCPVRFTSNTVIVTCSEDISSISKFAFDIPRVSNEFILTGLLRHTSVEDSIKSYAINR